MPADIYVLPLYCIVATLGGYRHCLGSLRLSFRVGIITTTLSSRHHLALEPLVLKTLNYLHPCAQLVVKIYLVISHPIFTSIPLSSYPHIYYISLCCLPLHCYNSQGAVVVFHFKLSFSLLC